MDKIEPKMPAIYSHKCDGDVMRCLDGNGCECEMAGRPPRRCDYTAEQMATHHAAWQAYAAGIRAERDALVEASNAALIHVSAVGFPTNAAGGYDKDGKEWNFYDACPNPADAEELKQARMVLKEALATLENPNE